MTLGRQMPVSFIRAKSWTAQTDHAVAQLGAIAAEDKRLLDARISAVLLRSVARTTDESTVLSYTELVSWSRHTVRHLSGRR